MLIVGEEVATHLRLFESLLSDGLRRAIKRLSRCLVTLLRAVPGYPGALERSAPLWQELFVDVSVVSMSEDEIGAGNAFPLDKIGLHISEDSLHNFKQDASVDVWLKTGLQIIKKLLALDNVVVRD